MDAGICKIMKPIMKSKTLIALGLRSTQFVRKGFQAIIKCLQCNASLKWIDLGKNTINFESYFAEFIEALRISQRFTYLNIGILAEY